MQTIKWGRTSAPSFLSSLLIALALVACSGPEVKGPSEEPQTRFTISPNPLVIQAGTMRHIAVYDNGELVRWPSEVTAQAVQGPLLLGASFGATTVRPSYFAEPQTAEYAVTVNSVGEYATVRGRAQIINRLDSVTISSSGLTRYGDEGRLRLIVNRSGSVDTHLTLSLAPVQGLLMSTEVQIPASYRHYVKSIPVEFLAGFAEGVELMYEASADGSSTSGSITLSTMDSAVPFDEQYLATLVVKGEGLVSFAVTDARFPGEGQVGTTEYELPAHISEHYDWAVERSVHEVEARSVEVSFVQDGHSCSERRHATNEFGKQSWIWSCRVDQ